MRRTPPADPAASSSERTAAPLPRRRAAAAPPAEPAVIRWHRQLHLVSEHAARWPGGPPAPPARRPEVWGNWTLLDGAAGSVAGLRLATHAYTSAHCTVRAGDRGGWLHRGGVRRG